MITADQFFQQYQALLKQEKINEQILVNDSTLGEYLDKKASEGKGMQAYYQTKWKKAHGEFKSIPNLDHPMHKELKEAIDSLDAEYKQSQEAASISRSQKNIQINALCDQWEKEYAEGTAAADQYSSILQSLETQLKGEVKK